MYAIQKPATEKILVKGLQISEHMLLRDYVLHHVITTIHMLPGQLPTFQTKHLKHYGWREVVKMFAVYSKNVCSNRIVW